MSLHELLSHPDFFGYTVANVIDVVNENDKKRFEIKEVPVSTPTIAIETAGSVEASVTQTHTSNTINTELLIRASQGHTIPFISDEELLTEITDPKELPVCIHGTKAHAVKPIMHEGLNRMSRNHIHMAVDMPGDANVISGMCYSCEAAIYINVPAAMRAGVRFFRSANNVILTKGINDSGILPPEFISKVVDLTPLATV